MDEIKRPNILHVYGQKAFHDDVVIAGTADALTQLAVMLQSALRHGEAWVPKDIPVFVNDGEGFYVRVKVIQPSEVDALAVPYSEAYAKETRDDARWP